MLRVQNHSETRSKRHFVSFFLGGGEAFQFLSMALWHHCVHYREISSISLLINKSQNEGSKTHFFPRGRRNRLAWESCCCCCCCCCCWWTFVVSENRNDREMKVRFVSSVGGIFYFFPCVDVLLTRVVLPAIACARALAACVAPPTSLSSAESLSKNGCVTASRNVILSSGV